MKRLSRRHESGLIILVLPLLLLTLAAALPAQTALLEPDVLIASFAIAENQSAEQLLEAALFFSGTSPERAISARVPILDAMKQARAINDSEPDEYKRGEAILALMHGSFLQRYAEFETTLDAAVLEGRYNCVSSAVLFMLLAREGGLDTRGVSTRDHALCTVHLSGGTIIDVETTNPHGWDPGSKKEFHDSFGKTTGYSYVPPSNYASRSELQGSALVTLIARNRAVIRERQGKWSGAVTLAVDAYAYWPSAESLEFLVDRINNYVAFLSGRAAWAEALPLLEKAKALYGTQAKIEKLLASARLAVLSDIVRQGDTELSLAAVRKSELEGSLPAKDRSDMLVYIFTKNAELAQKTGGWLAAWKALAESARSYPDVGALAKPTEQARLNWTYEVHNKFAGLYNAKRFSEALAILDDALLILPAEKLFLDDRKAALAEMKQ